MPTYNSGLEAHHPQLHVCVTTVCGYVCVC